MLFTQPADMYFTVFRLRHIVSGSMGEPSVESVFREFRIGPNAPGEFLSEFGQRKRNIVTPRVHIELNLRGIVKEGVQGAVRGMRSDWAGNLETPLLVAPHEAERQSYL